MRIIKCLWKFRSCSTFSFLLLCDLQQDMVKTCILFWELHVSNNSRNHQGQIAVFVVYSEGFGPWSVTVPFFSDSTIDLYCCSVTVLCFCNGTLVLWQYLCSVTQNLWQYLSSVTVPLFGVSTFVLWHRTCDSSLVLWQYLSSLAVPLFCDTEPVTVLLFCDSTVVLWHRTCDSSLVLWQYLCFVTQNLWQYLSSVTEPDSTLVLWQYLCCVAVSLFCDTEPVTVS